MRNPMHNARGQDARGREPQERERPADRGVDVGYQVIDEHIRQGQEAAHRARRARRRPNDVPFREEAARPGLSNLFWMWLEMLRRLPLTELAPLWRGASPARGGWAPFFEDEMDPVYPEGPWADEWDSQHAVAQDDEEDDAAWDPPSQGPSWREEREERAAAPQKHSPPRVKASVEIISKRPVQITLDIAPEACNRAARIPALYAIDVEAPPISSVQISGRGDLIVLRIEITDGQTAGHYAGVVVDRESSDTLGTVSLRITEG